MPSLDGLRGLAALVVVLGHSLNGVQAGFELMWDIIRSPLVPLVNAKLAIQLFFVLSGFVLTGSLHRTQNLRQVPQFFVRRICRIHLPYVAALLLSWLASFYYLPVRNQLTDFGATLFSIHLPVGELIRYLTFPGAAGGQLPVGWTLEIEMIFSLLMPVMLWFSRRTHVALLIALCALPYSMGQFGHPILKYGLDFAFGIALYLHGDRCRAAFGRIGGAGAWAWVAAMLVVGNLPLYLDWPSMVDGGSRGSNFLQSLGSAGLVAAAAYAPPISRRVAGRRWVFVGMISYSIYLLHWPVVALVASIPWPGSDLYMAPLVLASVIPVATASYYLVERPSIRLGSRISAWMTSRIARPRTGQ